MPLDKALINMKVSLSFTLLFLKCYPPQYTTHFMKALIVQSLPLFGCCIHTMLQGLVGTQVVYRATVGNVQDTSTFQFHLRTSPQSPLIFSVLTHPLIWVILSSLLIPNVKLQISWSCRQIISSHGVDSELFTFFIRTERLFRGLCRRYRESTHLEQITYNLENDNLKNFAY